jgi:hypothetical protein
MFRHSLINNVRKLNNIRKLNNVRKLNNIRKLNKCNQIIRRFQHNNTDIQKIVDELDNIKRNIQGIRTDNNAYNRKIVDDLDDIKKHIQGSRKDNDIVNYKFENALTNFMLFMGISGYCIAISILI